jgi:hypothetical protein
MSMPILTIDPDAEHREWVRSFTWHLDIVPPVMDTLIMMTLPTIPVSRGASRFDKVQITGGGYRDNMQLLDVFDTTGDGTMVKGGAEADARELWTWLVEYTRAVAEWITPTRPVPVLADKPDADPLTARAISLVTVGWLIDHADQIEPIGELDEHRDEMFALIRRLRGRYGVHRHPRRARPSRCDVCEAFAVVVDWVAPESGSPKPVQVGKCRECGAIYTEGAKAPHDTNGSAT